MASDEVTKELEELRGIANKGDDLSPYKERIARLYLRVCGKTLRQCRCKNVLSDALIEIYSKLKFSSLKANKIMAKARLVKGVVLQVGGNHYTNANLTDEVAREFLEKFPMRSDWFEELPSAVTGKSVVAEVAETPENGTEIAPNEIKPQSKPSASKKKKTSAKRK